MPQTYIRARPTTGSGRSCDAQHVSAGSAPRRGRPAQLQDPQPGRDRHQQQPGDRREQQGHPGRQGAGHAQEVDLDRHVVLHDEDQQEDQHDRGEDDADPQHGGPGGPRRAARGSAAIEPVGRPGVGTVGLSAGTRAGTGISAGWVAGSAVGSAGPTLPWLAACGSRGIARVGSSVISTSPSCARTVPPSSIPHGRAHPDTTRADGVATVAPGGSVRARNAAPTPAPPAGRPGR